MSPLNTLSQHDFAPSGFDAPAVVRALDAAAVVERGARRLLERGDYSPRERQQLKNATRVCRLAAVNRSPLAMLLDLSPRASLPDALWWVEMLRATVIARAEMRLPSSDLMHMAEEDANRAGNIAQQEHRERRTLSTRDALIDAMNTQAIASRLLADVSVHEMGRR